MMFINQSIDFNESIDWADLIVWNSMFDITLTSTTQHRAFYVRVFCFHLDPNGRFDI